VSLCGQNVARAARQQRQLGRRPTVKAKLTTQTKPLRPEAQSTDVSCQGFAVLDLASIVRRRTLASTAVGSDCHLLRYSVARGASVAE
jgi:hypothetical protein